MPAVIVQRWLDGRLRAGAIPAPLRQPFDQMPLLITHVAAAGQQATIDALRADPALRLPVRIEYFLRDDDWTDIHSGGWRAYYSESKARTIPLYWADLVAIRDGNWGV